MRYLLVLAIVALFLFVTGFLWAGRVVRRYREQASRRRAAAAISMTEAPARPRTAGQHPGDHAHYGNRKNPHRD